MSGEPLLVFHKDRDTHLRLDKLRFRKVICEIMQGFSTQTTIGSENI